MYINISFIRLCLKVLKRFLSDNAALLMLQKQMSFFSCTIVFDVRFENDIKSLLGKYNDG